MLQVKDVMSRDVLTTTEDTDIHSVARMLTDYRISGAPVVDKKGNPVGVISLHDLAFHQGQVGDSQAAAYWHDQPAMSKGFSVHDLSKSTTLVKDVMTPAVHSIDQDASLVELCDFFTKGMIHRVLVTQGGELVGIVTTSDLVGVLKKLLLAEASV